MDTTERVRRINRLVHEAFGSLTTYDEDGEVIERSSLSPAASAARLAGNYTVRRERSEEDEQSRND